MGKTTAQLVSSSEGWSNVRGITPNAAAKFTPAGSKAMGLETALIIGGIASTAASTAGNIYSANKQAGAAKAATKAQEKANTEALALERENELRRRQEWDQTQAENRRQWQIAYDTDASRWLADKQDVARKMALEQAIYGAEQRRRGPYRAMSLASMARLGELAGLNPQPYTDSAYAPPAGWSEADIAPPTPAAQEAATMAELARIQGRGRANG